MSANLLDRLIGYVSPALGARRLLQRTVMESYAGGSTTRGSIGKWRPRGGSARSDTLEDALTMRARSRDLTRNSPAATAAVAENVTHVVGTGLACQPRIDFAALGLTETQADAWQENTLREWCLCFESMDIDAGRRLDIYGLQRLALRAMLESGDVFALTPEIARPGRPYRLAVQLIEADRVSNPGWKTDTETLQGGIELDPMGAAIAAHVSRSHPGDLLVGGGRNEWARVPFFGERAGRRNLLHIFEPLRPGQVRGVPYLAPVIEPLKQLERYTEAELQAAVIAGAFSVFIKMDPDAFKDLFENEAQQALVDQAKKWDGELQFGKAVNLLPGEEPVTSNPGRPNAAFDPFVQAVMTQIGMALEIPFEVLLMRYQSSFSAARAALLMAWRLFRTRRAWLATYFCQPLYELFLAEAVAIGRIQAPGFFADPRVRHAWSRAHWIGDGPGAIDPEKEVAGAKARVDMGISTLDKESLEFDGIPWKDKHAQRQREHQARVKAGLEGEAGTPPAAKPAAAKADAEEEDAPAEKDSARAA